MCDCDEPSKKEIAIRESRDVLVRQAAVEGTNAPPITASKVQEQAKPQTVKDAWDDLAQRWEAFRVVDGEKDQRRLLLATANVDTELAHVVEESLGRDGITKRLISAISQEEGTA